MNQPAVGFGGVRHTRLWPRWHRFTYSSCFWWLPMRSLAHNPHPLLARNRRAWLSFHDTDHGQGHNNALQWLDDTLAAHGIHDADGEAWLMTYPRVAGYVFKPVSFWFCQQANGTLRAVVVEVNNTFGGRHTYVLPWPRLGRWCQTSKAFHVSPFNQVQGHYEFVFGAQAQSATGLDQAQRLLARIDYHTEAGCTLQTSLSGRLQPLTRRSWWRMALGYPLHSATVVARIHWQALRLWLKRVPFWGKQPPPPALHQES